MLTGIQLSICCPEFVWYVSRYKIMKEKPNEQGEIY
jgi:hypothetical protein